MSETGKWAVPDDFDLAAWEEKHGGPLLPPPSGDPEFDTGRASAPRPEFTYHNGLFEPPPHLKEAAQAASGINGAIRTVDIPGYGKVGFPKEVRDEKIMEIVRKYAKFTPVPPAAPPAVPQGRSLGTPISAQRAPTPMSSDRDPLVLTGDGRQIRQSRYYIEQQMAEQSAKLNSLLASPLAAGVYGATGNDTATGITAGLEGVAQGAGIMAGARGGHPQSYYQRAPETYLQQNQPRPKIGRTPPKQFYDDNVIPFQTTPQKRAGELLDLLNKLGDAAGSEGDKMEQPAYDPRIDPDKLPKSNDWSTGAPRGNTISEAEELLRNKELQQNQQAGRREEADTKAENDAADKAYGKPKFTDLTGRIERYGPPPTPGAQEAARKKAHRDTFDVLDNPFKPANDNKRNPIYQPADPNEYERSDPLKAPGDYADDAQSRQFPMRNDVSDRLNWDPTFDPLRLGIHWTTAEDLVTSGDWAKPMPPVSPLHPYEPFEQRLRSEARVKGLPPVNDNYLDTNFDRLREFLNPKDKPKK